MESLAKYQFQEISSVYMLKMGMQTLVISFGLTRGVDKRVLTDIVEKKIEQIVIFSHSPMSHTKHQELNAYGCDRAPTEFTGQVEGLCRAAN